MHMLSFDCMITFVWVIILTGHVNEFPLLFLQIMSIVCRNSCGNLLNVSGLELDSSHCTVLSDSFDIYCNAEFRIKGEVGCAKIP